MGKVIAFLVLFYLFLVSVKLMGFSLNLFGRGFTDSLVGLGRKPSVCLFIGIFGTSVLQSSGAVTSMVVVWGQSGMLPVTGAIAMVMGANIGTSVTNLLVSLSMITRSHEFRRAISGAIVHDFFNLIAVLIFFPLELATGFLRRSAVEVAHVFQNVGGAELVNLMDVLVSPVNRALSHFFLEVLRISRVAAGIILLALAVVLLFGSLIFIAQLMRRTVLKGLEAFFDKYLFRNAAAALLFGTILTMIVRSSSVATSLVVPLVGAGVLTVEQIFPYTLGANVGTTFSAMLAALVKTGANVPGTATPLGLTVAFAHLLFNLFGIVLIYPFRFIPITIAKRFGDVAVRRKSLAFIYIGVVFFVIPGIVILISELLK
jgi:sodium-dependent phosphate cotransporter